MSQLAQEYNQLIIFRHQTIYEEIINNIYNIYTIIFSIITKVNYYLFNLNIGFQARSRENKSRGLSENENKTNLVEISSDSTKEAYDLRSELNNDKKIQLNPYYITGFTDGEGCFVINITPRSSIKIGYSIWLAFKIKLHS